ncbi:hypothetical protein PSCICO_47030 [Pseudomonas cichorii]|uniref:Uncharacterized protein n=1 Tax=Pseudomonas cichorii TaxID=36746 RepID=A0ABQ1DII4_PSECI|nr:hypothetical protein [Pseudomonas cichorii]GFM89304.1 hypothetical protein PSCICO_47030 [Pseudomonas cichorii]GFM90812.1 hypothetical protein PSCICP_07840 [Pseudomonas cichorii]SDN32833.1 hypothetical protein SAMN05216599_101636 [Pseudomonas cichorii]
MNSSDRMGPEQVARLALAICATAESLGHTLSADAAELMADDLSGFPANVVATALKSCRLELTGKLTTGAIMQRVHAADGRPGKDEAWSIALAAGDESDTVVMTAEIRQAMTAAQPILAGRDKVGARMAFLSAYERLVAQARAEARPVSWSVSLGFDAGRRIAAIESAVRSKLITQEAGQQYLADLRIAPICQDGQAIAGLLTGTVVQPTEANRVRWQKLRSDLQKSRRDAQAKRLRELRAERRHLSGLKLAHSVKVKELTDGSGSDD